MKENHHNKTEDVSSASTHRAVAEERSKKQSSFASLMDDNAVGSWADEVENELDRYMAFRLPKMPEEGILIFTFLFKFLENVLLIFLHFTEKFNILDFWKNANQFPILQRVANWLLAIPASEACDERTFSSAGIYITPKSTNLSPGTLSDMVFMKKNAKI